MKKNTVDIITLGCSKNLVDSEQLMRQFEVLGYRVRHDMANPDGEIIIVNTCGFIGDAKEESINTILQLANRKTAKSRLYVMGCLSERYLADLEQEIPQVDKYFGKFNYTDILTEIGKEYRADLRLERSLTTPPHYAYIKISEGCNRSCSYCAIPIITGRHRSRSIEDIEKEVKILVDKGVKEFQIIAQDLSSYGLDRYKKMMLAELIERIANISGVEWIRLHYAYPAHFPYDVLHVMRENDKVCKYLDIALQHISDPMLKKMHRHISKQETYRLIDKIRNEVPGIHLRTTLLVGHPGETEQDFAEMKAFVRQIRFERLGAFSYSHEEGTLAYNRYKDDVPEEIKQRRLEEIMEIQQTIAAEHNSLKVGQTLKVIVDRREDNYFIARTAFDSPEVDPEVLISTDNKEVKIGEFYQAKIIGSSDFELFAV